MNPTGRARPDWDAIEKDFRLGRLTLRELAAKHGGVTHQGIARRAKAEGWKRDLTEAVQAATRAVEIEQSVAEAVAKAGRALTDGVAAAASVNAEVTARHRRFAARLTAIQDRLAQELAELDMAAERARLAVSKLIEGCPEAERAALQAIAKPVLTDLAKAADVRYRIDAYEALTRASQRVQVMERQTYRLDEAPQETDDSLEGLLERAEARRPSRSAPLASPARRESEVE